MRKPPQGIAGMIKDGLEKQSSTPVIPIPGLYTERIGKNRLAERFFLLSMRLRRRYQLRHLSVEYPSQRLQVVDSKDLPPSQAKFNMLPTRLRIHVWAVSGEAYTRRSNHYNGHVLPKTVKAGVASSLDRALDVDHDGFIESAHTWAIYPESGSKQG